MRTFLLGLSLCSLLTLSSCSKEVLMLSDRASSVYLADQALSAKNLELIAQGMGVNLSIVQTDQGNVLNVAGDLLASGRTFLVSPYLGKFLDRKEGYATFPNLESYAESDIEEALEALVDLVKENDKTLVKVQIMVDVSDKSQLQRGILTEQLLRTRFPSLEVKRTELTSFTAGILGPLINQGLDKQNFVVFFGLLSDIQVLRDLSLVEFKHAVWGFPLVEKPWPNCLGTFYFDLEGQFRQILRDLSQATEKTYTRELVKFKIFT